MASKIINQEGTMCDAPECEKFFFGERPKSWKTVTKVKDNGDVERQFDACSVKHGHTIIDQHIFIS